jgi:hypothetical protein
MQVRWKQHAGLLQARLESILSLGGLTVRATTACLHGLSGQASLALSLAVLMLISMSGCAEKIIGQIKSLRGIRTEQLRDEVRNDPERHSLLVFVHGFNSSKDAAWGDFPNILKNDPAFDDFNIHRFGYPTNVCAQVSDIGNQGELLASYLSSMLTGQQPKYSQVVLVGHSMGGLVILHALLKLERDQLKLLKETDLKVLTFGTPYLGVENTDVLLLFCENKQVNDMSALNDDLLNLGRDWNQRFNQSPGVGTRETPQIPLYAFRGTEDRFVTASSACAYPQIPCEAVDGDHDSIVKPTSSEHLSYKKLRHLATQPANTRLRSPPLQVLSVAIDEDRSSFLIDHNDLSIHALREDVVRTSIEFDRKMPDVFRSASCRGIQGETPIEDALPVWRDLLKKRGRHDLVERLRDYNGYRHLIVAGRKGYLDARPTAAELADLLRNNPDSYKLIMRWTVECVGIADPVLIWTLRNNSDKELVLTAVDYIVLDVGVVKGGADKTLEPIDINPHDLYHKTGTQTGKISPQILLKPADTVAIRIRYRMEAGPGLTWLVKPVFRSIEGISADGPELKIFSAK